MPHFGEARGGGRGGYWYIVLTDGVTHSVYDKNGNLAHSGPNAAVEINWALANLTVGRTYKQKVVVIGNYTIAAPIAVPSYTILDLTEARLYLANGSNCNMIQNSDQVAGNTDIEVVGGILNGNRTNQAGTLRGIYLLVINRAIIRNVTVYSARTYGIQISYAYYCIIYACIATDAGQHGIAVNDHVYYNVAEGNICYSNVNHGLDLENYAEHNVLANNNCYDNAKGIVVEMPPNRYNDIIGNICNTNMDGILLLGSSTNHLRFCNIIGNVVSNNKSYGIIINGYCSHNNIVGNVCVGNGTLTNNTYDDIYMRLDSNYNNIQNNLCRAGISANKPRYGINISSADCDENLVTNNDCYNDGFGTGAINDAGTGTVTAAGNRT